MKYFSLFSGIGGFELGIQQAYDNRQKTSNERGSTEVLSDNVSGTECFDVERPVSCVGFSEIDKYACQIYERHFNHRNYGDISKINAKELPDFDLLVGGFPCQSFSIAGQRGGFGDTRGTLFFEIARIAAEKRPSYLLLENVKGLLSHDKGRTFGTILTALDEIGYDAQWEVLNSKNFGVPQNRERVFIVGHLRGTRRPKVFPLGGTAVNDTGKIKVIGNLDSETWQKRHENIRRVHDVSGLSPTIPTGTGGGVMNKILDERGKQPFINTPPEEKISRTIRSGDKQSVTEKHNWDTHLINGKIRRLTPTECERLQGFPDNWTEGVSNSQRYKTLGNAVTVNVVQAVMERLI